MMKRICAATVLIFLFGITGQAAKSWQQNVDAVFGWKGQRMPDGVLRYTLVPYLTLSVHGVPTRPNLVLDGYAAFKNEGSTTLMTVEIAVPDARVDRVARTLEAGGVQDTAVHNHVLNESPR